MADDRVELERVPYTQRLYASDNRSAALPTELKRSHTKYLLNKACLFL